MKTIRSVQQTCSFARMEFESLCLFTFGFSSRIKKYLKNHATSIPYIPISQNGHCLNILLFLFKLDLYASFRAKYSFEF